MRRTTSHRERRAWGSRPVVGSSRKTSSGSLTRARAMARRCCWPPERVMWYASAFSLSCTRSSSSWVGRRLGIVAAIEVQGFAGGDLVEEARALELHADAGADLPAVVAPVQAEELDDPSVGGGEALDDLQGRGLARTVGTQQAEDLAQGHVEVQVVHGQDLGVLLAEPPDPECEHGHEDLPSSRYTLSGRFPRRLFHPQTCRMAVRRSDSRKGFWRNPARPWARVSCRDSCSL